MDVQNLTVPNPRDRRLQENAVFRYKTIFGRRMRSRSKGNQRAEVALACRILHTMTAVGMPDSFEGRSGGSTPRAPSHAPTPGHFRPALTKMSPDLNA